MHVAECFIHPVKSCAGLRCAYLDIELRGPAHDRRYMVVDSEGRFLTGRKLPRMVLIKAEPAAPGLLLRAPDMPDLRVAPPHVHAPRVEVQVWKDGVDAQSAGAAADAWFSRFLGVPARLVYMDQGARRRVDPRYAAQGTEVSFADGYPLLLVGQASLDRLNARLDSPLPMTRFRPNLVIVGGAPHVEDSWCRIRIRDICFDIAKPCTRCVFTTVDSTNGTFDPSGEPLATLKTYRHGERGITFGVNLIARDSGRIRVNDVVEVVEQS